jgi:hypothetical protein
MYSLLVFVPFVLSRKASNSPSATKPSTIEPIGTEVLGLVMPDEVGLASEIDVAAFVRADVLGLLYNAVLRSFSGRGVVALNIRLAVLEDRAYQQRGFSELNYSRRVDMAVR